MFWNGDNLDPPSATNLEIMFVSQLVFGPEDSGDCLAWERCPRLVNRIQERKCLLNPVGQTWKVAGRRSGEVEKCLSKHSTSSHRRWFGMWCCEHSERTIFHTLLVLSSKDDQDGASASLLTGWVASGWKVTFLSWLSSTPWKVHR
jgi:hypothetical protein